MAPTKNSTTSEAAAILIGGTPMPMSSPAAPAALGTPSRTSHERHARPVHVDRDSVVADEVAAGGEEVGGGQGGHGHVDEEHEASRE
jgi:hypothetical protein